MKEKEEQEEKKLRKKLWRQPCEAGTLRLTSGTSCFYHRDPAAPFAVSCFTIFSKGLPPCGVTRQLSHQPWHLIPQNGIGETLDSIPAPFNVIFWKWTRSPCLSTPLAKILEFPYYRSKCNSKIIIATKEV